MKKEYVVIIYYRHTKIAEQKHVYNIVMRAIENENKLQRLFFIVGFAGSGKIYSTYLTHL